MRRVSTRLGELDCQLVESLPEGTSPTLAILLCHGYGAPATDLVPLASQLMGLRPELARQAVFVFPAGLVPPADGPVLGRGGLGPVQQ
jgi:phospholipase/carboxylesterase